MIATIFYIAAAVCFLLAALSVPTGRLGLLGAGLFLWEVGEKFVAGNLP